MTVAREMGEAAVRSARPCPACAGGPLEPFLRVGRLPVFCNVLADTREEAREAPRGLLDLAICARCGMIRNLAYDSALTAYAPGYENSLHFSNVFERWARGLAKRLVAAYGRRGGTYADIGCGNGDFLRLLCADGESRGYGFDPSYAGEDANGRVRIIPELFDAAYLEGRTADIVCSRHVLEHLEGPAAFLSSIRESGAVADGTALYLEVPDARYMLRESEIWSLIYEHPSYFSAPSLQALLTRCGFEVLSIGTTFGDQFLFAEAHPGPPVAPSQKAVQGDTAKAFAATFARRIEGWRDRVSLLPVGSAVVWGAGSKGITFLNLVDSERRFAGIVDVNPRKVGRFVPGTGHQVLAPEMLTPETRHVVLMNSIYQTEVRGRLRSLGSAAQVETA